MVTIQATYIGPTGRGLIHNRQYPIILHVVPNKPICAEMVERPHVVYSYPQIEAFFSEWEYVRELERV